MSKETSLCLDRYWQKPRKPKKALCLDRLLDRFSKEDADVKRMWDCMDPNLMTSGILGRELWDLTSCLRRKLFLFVFLHKQVHVLTSKKSIRNNSSVQCTTLFFICDTLCLCLYKHNEILFMFTSTIFE